MRAWPALLLWTIGCVSEGTVHTVPAGDERPPLELSVKQPVHGAFLGDRDIVVQGTVTDPAAWVWVEGRRANVGTDGRFRVTLPIDGDMRVVDIEAAAPGEHLRERRAVFAGLDPLASWPGAVGLRLTPLALDHVAEILEQTIDELDLAGELEALLPTLEIDTFSVAPAGVSTRPADVTLVPGPDGIEMTIVVERAELGFDIDSDLTGPLAIVMAIDETVLGATATVDLDAQGQLVLSVADTSVAMTDPHLSIAGIEVSFLNDLGQGLVDLIAGLLEGLLDGLAGPLLGDLGLGELGSFELDLLGTPLTVELSDVGTDLDGVGAVLGVGFGDQALDPAGVLAPTASEAGPRADLAVAVHEGLFQLLLESDLLDLLEQDLELGGVLGEVIGLPVTALPGGHLAPADRTGWCLSVAPGDARAARLQDGTRPLAKLLLPDLILDVGVSTPSARCTPWLLASLELELALDLTGGTALGLDLEVLDGTVLAYTAEGDWPEAEIVDGLGGLLDASVGLLGGAFELDLAELFGGDLLGTGTGTTTGTGLDLGELAPRILDSEPMVDDEGQPIPGLYVLTLSLWD